MESLARLVILISLISTLIVLSGLILIVKSAFPLITGWWWSLITPLLAVIAFLFVIMVFKIIFSIKF